MDWNCILLNCERIRKIWPKCKMEQLPENPKRNGLAMVLVHLTLVLLAWNTKSKQNESNEKVFARKAVTISFLTPRNWVDSLIKFSITEYMRLMRNHSTSVHLTFARNTGVAMTNKKNSRPLIAGTSHEINHSDSFVVGWVLHHISNFNWLVLAVASFIGSKINNRHALAGHWVLACGMNKTWFQVA